MRQANRPIHFQGLRFGVRLTNSPAFGIAPNGRYLKSASVDEVTGAAAVSGLLVRNNFCLARDPRTIQRGDSEQLRKRLLMLA
jgi:hypothetical protein